MEGVKNALCAISQDYTILGYGYTDEMGNVVVEFFEPFDSDEDVDLVVTAYNMVPYITTVGTNEAPDRPERPDGHLQGNPEETYSYSILQNRN